MAGKDSGSDGGSSKGKAKMSQSAWDKLSNRQKERDYGGSRFESKGSGSSNKSKEAGHKDETAGHAAGRGAKGGRRAF